LHLCMYICSLNLNNHNRILQKALIKSKQLFTSFGQAGTCNSNTTRDGRVVEMASLEGLGLGGFGLERVILKRNRI